MYALIVGGVRSDKQDYLNSLKLVNELNLEENIIFTGSPSKIAEIYALSNVVVSSSKARKLRTCSCRINSYEYSSNRH